MLNQKMQRGGGERERKKERQRAHAEERDTLGPLAPLFICFFSSPWACPVYIGLARSAVCST